MNCNGTRSRVTTKMCTNCTWSYFWKNVYKLYMILEFFFWIASRISSHATSWISSHLLMLRRFSLAFWFEKSELKTDNDCFLQDQFRFTLISSQSNKIEVLGPAGSCLPFSCLESEKYSSLILYHLYRLLLNHLDLKKTRGSNAQCRNAASFLVLIASSWSFPYKIQRRAFLFFELCMR